MNYELKPCPNPACRDVRVDLCEFSENKYAVQCQWCKMRGPSKSLKDFAIAGWNAIHRAEEIEQLKTAKQDEMYLRGNQLAAISTILMSDTPVSLAAARIPADHALYTAAFQDAIRSVEKIIDLRAATIELEGKIDALAQQVNKLIDSCYYRTKAGKVHWKQGRYYGTSTADDTDPKAFEQAIAAIRRNAGIDELFDDHDDEDSE